MNEASTAALSDTESDAAFRTMNEASTAALSDTESDAVFRTMYEASTAALPDTESDAVFRTMYEVPILRANNLIDSHNAKYSYISPVNQDVHEEKDEELHDFSSTFRKAPNETNFNGLEMDVFHSTIPTIENSNYLSFTEIFKNGGWGMIKNKILETINLFTDGGDNESGYSEIIPIVKIKKFLEMGDKILFIHALSNKLDPKFSEFIADQLSPLLDKLHFFSNIGYHADFPSNVWLKMLMNFASEKTRFVISKIQDKIKAYATNEDLIKYRSIVRRLNPLAASGLDLILDSNFTLSKKNTGRPSNWSRMYDLYEPDRMDRDDQYGYGGGGGGGGYGHDQGHGGGYQASYNTYKHIDPYLLLAGLGAATLLAYVAYRILVTTAAGRKKRDVLGVEELTDMPEFVYIIYDMIEKAEDKYSESEEDDFTNNLNSLWRESETGCIRCVLHDQFKDRVQLDKQYLEHVIT